MINKPANMTSYDVIRKLKKLLPRKTKIGHLGTLDPMVTGVLPIAVGNATKIIPFIEDETKEYVATLTLGGHSDTEDAWGNITYSYDFAVNEEQIIDVINSMVGEIEQTPPMYSAIHHEGKKLYELARQGITIERASRKVNIYEIEIININLNVKLPRVEFRVLCSKGTYIRTLCKDIGEKLGIGGYLSSLVRTKSGVFAINQSQKLKDIIEYADFMDKYKLPLDYPILDWPIYQLKNENEWFAIINGNTINIELGEKLPLGHIRIYYNNFLIALAKVVEEGLAIKPVRVFNTV
ncbi:MAG: tRNA pseudouridine(55) synthase TruB [Syntrophomonadaceae bacterium]|nr:tRNA pseudouridine(55) synthase TruB [Syntrophomonadaceae bacterium]